MHDVYFPALTTFTAPGFKVVDVPSCPGRDSQLTFYTRHGDLFGWTCVAQRSRFFCGRRSRAADASKRAAEPFGQVSGARREKGAINAVVPYEINDTQRIFEFRRGRLALGVPRLVAGGEHLASSTSFNGSIRIGTSGLAASTLWVAWADAGANSSTNCGAFPTRRSSRSATWTKLSSMPASGLSKIAANPSCLHRSPEAP